MRECRWSKRVERWYDGESHEPETVAEHVHECPACAALLKRMKLFREGIRAVAVRAEIADPQLSAFTQGIHEGLQRPVPRRTGLWTVLSLSAAALIVAISLFAVFTGGPAPAVAQHTVVESASTEVEGATVKTQNSTDNKRAVIWVHRPQKDVL
jgi:anti-sigma factor RsiW